MLILKQMTKAALFVAVLAVLLFGVSGNLFWGAGWLYLAVFAGCSFVSTMIMIRHNPALLVERMRPGGDAKSWDRTLAPTMAGLCPALIVTAAALEARFGGAPAVPAALQAVFVAVAAAGHALMTWAMMTNGFFSALVRIQKDRGHRVVSKGPYRFVRHPGYVGMMVFALATPVVLGSLWAFVPAGINLGVGIVRTALEDRTLNRELEGYGAYARTVPYRLLPGVW